MKSDLNPADTKKESENRAETKMEVDGDDKRDPHVGSPTNSQKTGNSLHLLSPRLIFPPFCSRFPFPFHVFSPTKQNPDRDFLISLFSYYFIWG